MNKKEEGLSEPVWNVAELLERVDNDQELLRELLTIFKEDFPLSFQSLKSAVIAADAKSASRLSHTLKAQRAQRLLLQNWKRSPPAEKQSRWERR